MAGRRERESKADKKDLKRTQRNPSSRRSARTGLGRRAKTLKLFCRCGQKLRITFPTPKKIGKCPQCGHKFTLP